MKGVTRGWGGVKGKDETVLVNHFIYPGFFFQCSLKSLFLFLIFKRMNGGKNKQYKQTFKFLTWVDEKKKLEINVLARDQSPD